MKCYITGEECTCGGFDVATDCPYDDYLHGDDEEFDDDDHATYAIERRFAEMSEQI